MGDWLRYLEAQAAPQVASDVGTWAFITAFVIGVLAVGAFVPPVQAMTGLQFVPAVLAFAPVPIVAIALGAAKKHGSPRTATIMTIVGDFVIELFPAVLIGVSSFAGGAIFAAFYLVATLFHAQILRVSTRWPFFAALFIVHAAVSLALDHSDEKIALWAILLPAAITASLVAGTSTVREDERRHALERTRIALDAQVLEVQAQKGKQLEDRIHELLGFAHDIKSPLSAALLDVGKLEAEARALGAPSVLAQTELVRGSLGRLRTLFEATRAKAHAMEMQRESVELPHVVDGVVGRARRNHPHITFETSVDPQARAFVVGGPQTLERIVENVVLNACEGDGKRAARRVKVDARRAEQRLEVVVEDDGPGFAPAMLEGDIAAFRTTKKDGTGLGLFTVERLARACGGSVQRGNLEGGGAYVVVDLPLG